MPVVLTDGNNRRVGILPQSFQSVFGQLRPHFVVGEAQLRSRFMNLFRLERRYEFLYRGRLSRPVGIAVFPNAVDFREPVRMVFEVLFARDQIVKRMNEILIRAMSAVCLIYWAAGTVIFTARGKNRIAVRDLVKRFTINQLRRVPDVQRRNGQIRRFRNCRFLIRPPANAKLVFEERRDGVNRARLE